MTEAAKDDALYLRYLLGTTARIARVREHGKDEFLSSTILQDAVLRNLHTMTETTQRLSDRLKELHPEVDWRTLAAFRNVLVHDYLGVDIELIWRVVTQDVPDFEKAVLAILEAESDEDHGLSGESADVR